MVRTLDIRPDSAASSTSARVSRIPLLSLVDRLCGSTSLAGSLRRSRGQDEKSESSDKDEMGAHCEQQEGLASLAQLDSAELLWMTASLLKLTRRTKCQ